MTNFSNIGLTNSNDVLDKLRRDRSSLDKAILKQEASELHDTILNFCIWGYHIKDWLKKEGFKRVENYINDNLELRICADLCNGAKHKILTSFRESNDPVNSIDNSEVTWDSKSYTLDSPLKFDSKTYSIKLESGRGVEIMQFATTVVKLWEEFIR